MTNDIIQRINEDAFLDSKPRYGRQSRLARGTPTQAYVDRVLDVIDRCGESVVLAVHSMGGIVISQAAEQRCCGTAQDNYALDRAFSLIEGHPAFCPKSHLSKRILFRAVASLSVRGAAACCV